MTDLPDDIESLKAIIQQLVAETERLKAENAELRRRLGLDSANSHKPPSSDGYQKKTIKPGLPQGEKQAKGGQPVVVICAQRVIASTALRAAWTKAKVISLVGIITLIRSSIYGLAAGTARLPTLGSRPNVGSKREMPLVPRCRFILAEEVGHRCQENMEP